MKEIENISLNIRYKNGIKIYVDFIYDEAESLFFVNCEHGFDMEVGVLHNIKIKNDEKLRDAYLDAFKNLYSYQRELNLNSSLSEEVLGGLEDELMKEENVFISTLPNFNSRRDKLNYLIEKKINLEIEQLLKVNE